jgi:hypothetical protein
MEVSLSVAEDDSVDRYREPRRWQDAVDASLHGRHFLGDRSVDGGD